MRSQFGFHVLQLVARHDGAVKPFDDVQADIGRRLAEAYVDTVARVYLGLSSGRFDAVETAAHPDVERVSIGDGKNIRGLAENKKVWQQGLVAFPDTKLVPEVVIGVGDWVIARGLVTATHKGELLGKKATNLPVSAHFADVFRFEAGKIRRVEAYRDAVEFLAPLGVLAFGRGD